MSSMNDTDVYVDKNHLLHGGAPLYQLPVQAAAPVTIANPAPLGLCAFAVTTFVLSLFNAGAFGIAIPHVIVGLAFFYGGLAQMIAGMWEFKTGNTFGATAFTSYGAFWMSFAVIFIPGFGILEAYSTATAQLENALGVYLLSWTIFTFVMFLATFRSTRGLVLLFGFLLTTFMLLTLHKFTGIASLGTGGGILGVLTAFIAWYNALAGLLTPQTSYFTLPVGDLKPTSYEM